MAAVVVTYNRRAALERTLARLLAEPFAAVVVVDNGSSDGSRAMLAAHPDPRLLPVLAERNLGGAGGFERGIAEARARVSPDWVVVMDDDARPEPGALAAFAEAAPGWDMIAAAVHFPDGHICEMNRPSRNPFWHLREAARTAAGALVGRGRQGFHVPDSAYEADAVQPVDVASFVGLFISTPVIERIGLPDGRLFIYGDDVSYCLRARKAGFRIGFAPGVRFEHACATFAAERVYSPLWKVYYNYRNGLLSYRDAAGAWFWLVAPVFLAKWALLARRYGPDRRAYLKILARALRDGFSGRREVPHEEVLAFVAAARGGGGAGAVQAPEGGDG